MGLCVRCKKDEAIKDELVCEVCLNWLCIQYNVKKGEDPFENAEIKALIESYSEMEEYNMSRRRRDEK